MPGPFSETIAAALAGERVVAAWLYHFAFVGAPMRTWTGDGILEAGGQQWLGTKLISVSALEQAANGEAPLTTFTLSGVDPETNQATAQETDRVREQPVTAYLQYFAGPGDSMIPTDDPVPLWRGIMKSVQFKATGPTQRQISVSAESRFSLRSRPRHGALTDRDQQARFPGDRFCEFVPAMAAKTVTWPEF